MTVLSCSVFEQYEMKTADGVRIIMVSVRQYSWIKMSRVNAAFVFSELVSSCCVKLK